MSEALLPRFGVVWDGSSRSYRCIPENANHLVLVDGKVYWLVSVAEMTISDDGCFCQGIQVDEATVLLKGAEIIHYELQDWEKAIGQLYFGRLSKFARNVSNGSVEALSNWVKDQRRLNEALLEGTWTSPKSLLSLGGNGEVTPTKTPHQWLSNFEKLLANLKLKSLDELKELDVEAFVTSTTFALKKKTSAEERAAYIAEASNFCKGVETLNAQTPGVERMLMSGTNLSASTIFGSHFVTIPGMRKHLVDEMQQIWLEFDARVIEAVTQVKQAISTIAKDHAKAVRHAAKNDEEVTKLQRQADEMQSRRLTAERSLRERAAAIAEVKAKIEVLQK